MIIRFIIFVAAIYLFYRIIKYLKKNKSVPVDNYKSKPIPAGGEDLVEDPFCHTYIPVSQAYKKVAAGKEYCFCSKECCESYFLQKNKERQ